MYLLDESQPVLLGNLVPRPSKLLTLLSEGLVSLAPKPSSYFGFGGPGMRSFGT